MNLILSTTVLILVFVFVVNILLGYVAYRSNPENKVNKIFALLSIVISIWLLVMQGSLRLLNADFILFLIRFSLFLAVPISLLFYFFALALPDGVLVFGKKMYILVFSAALVMFITLTPFVFSHIEISSEIPKPIPGIGIPFFSLFTISLSLLAIFTLVKKVIKSSGIVKRQLRLISIGIFLMLSLIITTILIPVIMFSNNTFVPLFPLYTLFFTGMTAYAVVRHEMFDIKVITTEAVTVILWVVLFAKIFVAKNLTESAVDIAILITVVIFGILLIKSVIREVKQREKLQELTEKLKALDKQKDEFLSMAAHELRAPMTAIKGYVSMVLEGDTGDIPEKARGFLADTSNITDRLIRLVNNMLNVSRIEEGRMTYQQEKEYLSVPVRMVFNQFNAEAERKGLEYSIEIPQQIKNKVIVDPDRIQEVVGNFLSNAIKYTDEGFVKVKMSQPDDKTVRVEVIDSGPGISEEEQEKLFQKFQRVESNVGKTTGSGLGLYISKLLIEKFGGKIGVTSKLREGSNFWFELPLTS